MGDKYPSGGASGAGRKKRGVPKSTQEFLDIDNMTLEERNKTYRRIQLSEEQTYLQNLYLSQNRTPEGEASLSDYKGSGYRPINSYLREGTTGNEYWPADIAAQHVQNLDSMVIQMPEAITMYRGFSNNGPQSAAIIDKFFAAHNEGTIKNTLFQDPGYGSSSIDRDRAFGGQLMFRIRTSKGTKVLVPDRNGPVGSEREIILNRGTKYRVIGSTLTTSYGVNKLEVEVEAVQD